VALAVGLALLRPLVTPDMAIFGTFGRADALLLGGAVALSGARFPSWSPWAGLGLVVLIGLLQPDDAVVAAWGLTLASVAGVLLVGDVRLSGCCVGRHFWLPVSFLDAALATG
jgi:hypothetical protein